MQQVGYRAIKTSVYRGRCCLVLYIVQQVGYRPLFSAGVGSRLPFSAAGCVDGYGYRYIDLV